MTFDSEQVCRSAKKAKKLIGKVTDMLDNYSVRKTAVAKVEVKSKKPEKTLYQYHFRFDKEISLVKLLCLFTGGMFVAYSVLGIAKFVYKMDCKREWDQKQKAKRQYSLFDE